MKKLMMFVMAVVFAAAFVPGAYAAESAQLGLQVTFAPNNPITMRTDPEGPFKIESGKELVFTVNADNATSLKCESALPYGATFTVMYLHAIPINGQGESTYAIGTFKWTPKNLVYSGSDALQIIQLQPIQLTFSASNSNNEAARLVVEITVVPPQRVISIELNQASWNLDGVKLGEKRDNFQNPYGKPIHVIKNAGNVSVLVDIGYGPTLIKNGMPPIIHPGLEQGLDTFITVCENGIIPPNARVPVVKLAEPGATVSLGLTYGAPTALSQNGGGMSATYELRAYPASITVDPPIVITR